MLREKNNTLSAHIRTNNQIIGDDFPTDAISLVNIQCVNVRVNSYACCFLYFKQGECCEWRDRGRDENENKKCKENQ